MSSQSRFLLYITLVVFTYPVSAQEAQRSLSTSGLVETKFRSGDGVEGTTCGSGSRSVSQAQSYVSIGIQKMTVNKKDSWLKRLLSEDHHVFATAQLKGQYQNQPLAVSRVGKPFLLKGKKSSVDLGATWGLLEKVPWVLTKASLDLKIGYASTSRIKTFTDAFSSITSGIPDYTVSTSVTTGLAITNSVDRILFGSERAQNLLDSQRDLPLTAGTLCEGFYAVFASSKNDQYEKYYDLNTTWTGNDLEYNGDPINDVSYVVLSVTISDRYYANPEDAVNDRRRAWSDKYNQVLSDLYKLAWVSTLEELKGLSNSIKTNLMDGLTLITADYDLVHQERGDIHSYVQDLALDQLAAAGTRINNGAVTQESTATAIALASNVAGKSRVDFLSSALLKEASLIAQKPELNLPQIDPGFGDRFKAEIGSIERVIRLQ